MAKPNVFLFVFENEEGRTLVMEEGPYTFDRRPFILAPWASKMKMEIDKLQKLSVWVQFPYLP